MSLFDCCKNCSSPKRHSGCHITCEEYIKDKQVWEARKTLIEENKKKYPSYKTNDLVNPWRKF